jgi:hypothetical protein
MAGLAAAAASAILVCVPPARAVQVSAGYATATAGQTVDVAMTTSKLSGLGVLSYQFTLNYNSSLISAVGVINSGTLTEGAGWSGPSVNITAGSIQVGYAGTRPLQGSGDLIKVRFTVSSSAVNGGGSPLQFTSFKYNEGAPRETLSTGYVNILPSPMISISPNSGELARGQTLQFGVSGNVLSPLSIGTTRPTVAMVSGTGLLTALTAGSTKVFAIDAAGHRDTTDQDIVVRAAEISVGSISVAPGAPIALPILVTEMGGAGIRSGQISVGYPSYLFTPTSVSTVGGVLEGHGSIAMGLGAEAFTVSFADSRDLVGAGTLCVVSGIASSVSLGGGTLQLQRAVFNEDLPAKRVDGYVSVSAPSFTVSPETSTLLAGQTAQFGVYGQYTAPITWSTLSPSIATIDANGLLTARAGGVTRVRARDALGATDDNTSVTVHDLQVSVPSLEVASGSTVVVPVSLDRTAGALDIQSVQFAIAYDPSLVTGVRLLPGLLSSTWGGPTWSAKDGRITVAGAGSTPLGNSQTTLCMLSMDIAWSAPLYAYSGLTFTSCALNEGQPMPATSDGSIRVTSLADIGEGGSDLFALQPPWPCPGRPPFTIRYSLSRSSVTAGSVDLSIFGVDGRRIRTLQSRAHTVGEHSVMWDGLDASGRQVPAGLYLCRLSSPSGGLERKVVFLR